MKGEPSVTFPAILEEVLETSSLLGLLWATCISGGGLAWTRGLTLACTSSVASRVGEEDLLAESLGRRLIRQEEEAEKAEKPNAGNNRGGDLRR